MTHDISQEQVQDIHRFSQISGKPRAEGTQPTQLLEPKKMISKNQNKHC